MSKAQQTAKREAAEARQKRYDALSTKQKLENLDSRPGNAKRERARLAK